MKKILLGLLCVVSTTAFAQSAKTIKQALDTKDYVKANTEVDALLAKDDKKAENWYFKHKALLGIGTTDALKSTDPDALTKGMEAYKKFISLSGSKKTSTLAMDGIIDESLIPNTYRNEFIRLGAPLLDAKAYGDAFSYLSKALDVFDYMHSEKLVAYKLDTLMTFYTGYAAQLNNDKPNAMKYYKLLTDAGATGQDINIAYEWMANYYNEGKETDKANAIIEKGLSLYPENKYLASVKSDIINSTGDFNSIAANYEKVIAQPNAEFTDYLSYAAVLFDYVYVDKKATTDLTERSKRFDEVITKAIQMKPSNPEANFIMGLYKSNIYQKIEDDIKVLRGKTTPADKAAREKLQADRDVKVQEATKHMELYTSFMRAKGAKRTAADTDNYKTALSQLIYYAKYKKEADRAKSLEETLAELK